jgi:glycosyltransferase 2 family protein
VSDRDAVRLARNPRRSVERDAMTGFAVRLAFSLAVLGIVLYVVDVAETWQVLQGLDPALMVVAFACLFGTRFLVGFKWWLLLGGRRAAVTYPTVQRAILLADYQGLLFPNTLAVDALRLVLLRHHPRGMTYMASTILADRILNTMVAASLALLGMAALLWLPTGADIASGVVHGVLITASLILAAGIAVMSDRLFGLVTGIARGLLAHGPLRRPLERILAKAAELHRSTTTVLAEPATVARAIAVSILVVLLRIGLVYFLFAAVGTWLGLLPVVAIYPIIMLIVLLPISILGVGVQDTAFIFFFGGLGIAASLSLAISMAVYAAILVVSLAAGLIAALVGPALPTAGQTRQTTADSKS